MRINTDIANRALGLCGQSSLTVGDKASKPYVMVKKHYLSTFLESLEAIAWTSGKRRAVLKEAAGENLSGYAHAFVLPLDCGKIIELKDKSYYIVEGNTIYTDGQGILIYITNGKISGEAVENKKQAADAAGIPFDEEFPEYEPPLYEALFWASFELRLASKFALELSGDANLHQMLLNEAMMQEQAAYRATKTRSAGKKSGNAWWIERR